MMADYNREDLWDKVRSVIRKDDWYEREDVIVALARHVGFARVTENTSTKVPIVSAARQ
ncbi:MAG: hypothetical protein K1X57_22870 [Gemmataceae bacterium]|nr:hypothetical protein [Gemmataceae bacterium]